jgi:tetratricopeptide (TPR) repeat protein
MVVLLLGCLEVQAETALEQGKQLEGAGKFAEALKVFQTALRDKPTPELFLAAGSLLGKQKQFPQACRLLEEGLKKFPGNSSLGNLHGMILLRLGKNDEAVAQWKLVLETDSTNAFAIEALKKQASAPDVENPPTSPSQPNEQRLIGANPDAARPAEARPDEARDKNKPGTYSEQCALATQLYEEMIQTDENDIDTFKRLHQKVIDLCPDSLLANRSRWMLSNIYYFVSDTPDWEKIITVLEPGIMIQGDPGLAVLGLNRLLNAYRATGKTDKMVAVFEQVLSARDALDDSVAMPWEIEYARLLKEKGQADKAQAVYQRLLTRNNAANTLYGRLAQKELAGLQ